MLGDASCARRVLRNAPSRACTCPDEDGRNSQGRSAHGCASAPAGVRASAGVLSAAMRHAAASEHSFITRAAQRQQSSDPLPPSRGGDQRRQQQQRDYCQHCAAVAAILRQQALSLWAATKEHEEPQLYLRSGNDLVGFPAGACRRVHACPGNAGSWLSMAASPCPRRPARRQSPPGRLPSCLRVRGNGKERRQGIVHRRQQPVAASCGSQ